MHIDQHSHRALPHDRRARRPLRLAVQVALPLVAVAGVLLAVPAHAEGPGYGGGADKLAVAWNGAAQGSTAPSSPASPSSASPASPGQPVPASSDATPPGSTDAGSPSAVAMAVTGGGRGALAAGANPASAVSITGPALTVSGVGFRGLSEVRVRVGSSDPFTARVDDTGTLTVLASASEVDPVTAGTSVVAVGRAPSGTTKILVGSVPPRPSGTGPVDLVPWLVVAVLVGLSGSWLVSRITVRGTQSDPAPIIAVVTTGRHQVAS